MSYQGISRTFYRGGRLVHILSGYKASGEGKPPTRSLPLTIGIVALPTNTCGVEEKSQQEHNGGKDL